MGSIVDTSSGSSQVLSGCPLFLLNFTVINRAAMRLLGEVLFVQDLQVLERVSQLVSQPTMVPSS